MSENESQIRSGIVSIIGRPNTGKSTLLNAILDEKVTIVSKVPQTTRYQIRGIYHDKRGQIVFIDTPGIHVGNDGLDRLMNQSSFSAMQDIDCIIHLVDTNRRVGKEEEMVISRLKDVKVPIILGLNKVDIQAKYADEYISLWQTAKGDAIHESSTFVILPLSGKTGQNIEKLLTILFDLLSHGPWLYPKDVVTDLPQRMVIADYIREKLFELMQEEIPHSISVLIANIEPKPKKVTVISAVILVERESQKRIIIGKKGNILKEVGMLARRELEDLLGRKIFLELHVKVEKNWRNNPTILQDMGCEI